MSGDSDNRADNGGTAIGVNHIVVNVRDIEEAHRFWTEIIGLKQVGELHPRTDMGPGPVAKMRFYSGDHGGEKTHPDVPSLEKPNLPPPPAQLELFCSHGLNHHTESLPGRGTWLETSASLPTT